jgi:hypothetical protein
MTERNHQNNRQNNHNGIERGRRIYLLSAKFAVSRVQTRFTASFRKVNRKLIRYNLEI